MIAFIHIGKTGGLTLQSILASQYGLSHCDVVPWDALSNPHALEPFGAQDFRKLKWLYPNLACLSGHHIMPYADLDQAIPGLRYFGFLRDPVDRMASAYQQMCKTDPNYMSFEAYCDIESHRNQQCQVIGGSQKAQSAIDIIKEKNVFIGLMEKFDESLILLKALHINELHIDYTRRNDAPNQSVSNALLGSEEKIKLLKDATCEDLKLYEYARTELYEAYKHNYGGALNADVAEFKRRPGSINKKRIFMSKMKRKVLYEPLVKLHRLKSAL